MANTYSPRSGQWRHEDQGYTDSRASPRLAWAGRDLISKKKKNQKAKVVEEK